MVQASLHSVAGENSEGEGRNLLVLTGRSSIVSFGGISVSFSSDSELLLENIHRF